MRHRRRWRYMGKSTSAVPATCFQGQARLYRPARAIVSGAGSGLGRGIGRVLGRWNHPALRTGEEHARRPATALAPGESTGFRPWMHRHRHHSGRGPRTWLARHRLDSPQLVRDGSPVALRRRSGGGMSRRSCERSGWPARVSRWLGRSKGNVLLRVFSGG